MSEDWILEIKPEQLEQYRRLIKLAAGEEQPNQGSEQPSTDSGFSLSNLGLSDEDLKRVAIGSLIGLVLGSLFGSSKENPWPTVLLTTLGAGGLAYFLPRLLGMIQTSSLEGAKEATEEWINKNVKGLIPGLGGEENPAFVEAAKDWLGLKEDDPAPGLFSFLLGKHVSGPEYAEAFRDYFEKGKNSLPMDILATDWTPVPLPPWFSGGFTGYAAYRLARGRGLPLAGLGSRIGGGIHQLLSEMRPLGRERLAVAQILGDEGLRSAYLRNIEDIRFNLRNILRNYRNRLFTTGGLSGRERSRLINELIDYFTRPARGLVDQPYSDAAIRDLLRRLEATPSGVSPDILNIVNPPPGMAQANRELMEQLSRLRPSAFLEEAGRPLSRFSLLRRFRMPEEMMRGLRGARIGAGLGRLIAAYAILDFLLHAARAWHSYSQRRVPGFDPELLNQVSPNTP